MKQYICDRCGKPIQSYSSDNRMILYNKCAPNDKTYIIFKGNNKFLCNDCFDLLDDYLCAFFNDNEDE